MKPKHAEEFSDVIARLKKELKPLLEVGKYLSITEDLDTLESTLNQVVDIMRKKSTELTAFSSAFHMKCKEIEDIRTKLQGFKSMTFAERLKFLFNKEDQAVGGKK